jgi:threonine synthase
VTVSDDAMERTREDAAREEGLLLAPEAAATLAAARELRESGWLDSGSDVVAFLTGNGFKYPMKGAGP